MKRHVYKITKLKGDAHFYKNKPFPLPSLLRHIMVHKTNLSIFFTKGDELLNSLLENHHFYLFCSCEREHSF
jgi:hypothetical protein